MSAATGDAPAFQRKRTSNLPVRYGPPDGGYLAETYKEQLPKASIGKSCIRFKRLGDVDQEVLERLLRNDADVGPRAPDVVSYLNHQDPPKRPRQRSSR